jgi:hypothetical protein
MDILAFIHFLLSDKTQILQSANLYKSWDQKFAAVDLHKIVILESRPAVGWMQIFSTI